jgi:hypothetical protein
MIRLRVTALVGYAVLAWSAATAAEPTAVTIGRRDVVFFPPFPPVYGAPIEVSPGASGTRLLGGRRLSPPDGLANFVAEDFYPALSTRLFVPELKKEIEVRVHQYRAQRLNLVTDLLNQFVTLHQQSADERERQLRAFAETQTPQLVALEAESERLRQDIIRSGLWNVDWNAGRRWKLGTMDARGDAVNAEAEFQVVRATAYYQAGLLSQQRGLVREMAFDLQIAARKARGLPGARGDSDAMYFSPETTRFRLPPDMSPTLREKVGAYNGRKAELKRELRETIVACEGKSASERTSTFEALGDRQWPELRNLEELAEEIRRLLAVGFEVKPPPAPPWLPAGMMQTILSYNDDRDTYFGELKRYADQAVAMVSRDDAAASSDDRVQQDRDFAARRAETRRIAVLEFQERHRVRFLSLEQRYKMIREALAVVAEKQTDRKTGRPLDADALLRQHGASMAEFETFGRETTIYSHYRIAMFQPGLSPEQRRLLFGYALVGLAQGLPGGEVMPKRSAPRPFPSW